TLDPPLQTPPALDEVRAEEESTPRSEQASHIAEKADGPIVGEVPDGAAQESDQPGFPGREDLHRLLEVTDHPLDAQAGVFLVERLRRLPEQIFVQVDRDVTIQEFTARHRVEQDAGLAAGSRTELNHGGGPNGRNELS